VAIDPVREPFAIRAALGGDGTTGYDWFVYLYKAARNAFPKLKLLVTEDDLLSNNWTLPTFVRVVNVLKNQKLVDGIGVWVHDVTVTRLVNSTVIANLNTFGATGLPVYVTDLTTSINETTEIGIVERLFPLIWTHTAVKGVFLDRDIRTLLSRAGEELEALSEIWCFHLNICCHQWPSCQDS
jgi:endo-1,4-beta-xylanase